MVVNGDIEEGTYVEEGDRETFTLSNVHMDTGKQRGR